MTTDTTETAYRDIIEHLKKGAEDVIAENTRLAAQRLLLTDECAELKRRLNIEEDLVNDFAVKLKLCQEELEKHKAVALMNDPAVVEELASHGLKRVGA